MMPHSWCTDAKGRDTTRRDCSGGSGHVCFLERQARHLLIFKLRAQADVKLRERPVCLQLRACLDCRQSGYESTIPAYNGAHDATAFGPSCPQQSSGSKSISGNLADDVLDTLDIADGFLLNDGSVRGSEQEDCLTINVIKPANATLTSKHPVVVWIFGGGFEGGGTSGYDGTVIVNRSINLGTPIIYVSMNYRVAGFGFLGGKEVKAAGVGNIGLHDQRVALKWVKKYIGAFGGDHNKVTIWGQSAGAISVALHMVANNGSHEGLFRGAFMQSGSHIPVGDITKGQKYYDAMVSLTGCSKASDTLACLRTVPYNTLKSANDNASPGIFSYQSLVLSWLPRPDGSFITDNPQKLLQQGKIANIPVVSGLCDDEGTLFSLAQFNITNDAKFRAYIKEIYVPGANDSVVSKLAELYPDDVTAGSPFDTGTSNALYSQFKRLAAFQGDGVFQAPRRFFLEERSGKQPAWAYLSKRVKDIRYVGSAHGVDVPNIYGGRDLTNYLVRFVVSLDPNGHSSIQWPKYTPSAPKILTLRNGGVVQTIDDDTARKEAMSYLTRVTLENPI